MKKKNKTWLKILIAVVAIGLIGVGVFYFVLVPRVQNNTAVTPTIVTATLEEGVLTSTIGATGKIESVQSSEISWETSGTIEEVGVVVGDTVSKGDVLASLAKESMPEDVILAVEDYYDAKDALDELQNSVSESEIAEAEKAVANAKEALKDADWNYSYLSSPADQTYVDEAYADVLIAKKQLNVAEDKWEEWVNVSEENVNRAYVQQEYIAAQQNYDAKVAYYNNVSTPATALDLEVAAAELRVAQEQLVEAEEALAEAQAGATADEIAAAEAKVIAAQQKMEKQFLEAPFDGVVTDSDVTVNDAVESGSFAFRIDDLSAMQIELNVSELDINEVAIGQRAVISFDSLVGQEFEGAVVSKGLVGETISNIVYYPVVVEISDPDVAIQIGMSATVDIYVESSESSVLVPNTAITVVNGEQVVYVMTDSLSGGMFGGAGTGEGFGNGAGDGAGAGMDDLSEEELAAMQATREATMANEDDEAVVTRSMPDYVAVTISVGMSSESYSTIVQGDLEAGMEVVLDPSTLNATSGELTENSGSIFGMLFGGGGGGMNGGGGGGGRDFEGGPPSGGEMPAGGPPGGN